MSARIKEVLLPSVVGWALEDSRVGRRMRFELRARLRCERPLRSRRTSVERREEEPDGAESALQQW